MKKLTDKEIEDIALRHCYKNKNLSEKNVQAFIDGMKTYQGALEQMTLREHLLSFVKDLKSFRCRIIDNVSYSGRCLDEDEKHLCEAFEKTADKILDIGEIFGYHNSKREKNYNVFLERFKKEEMNIEE